MNIYMLIKTHIVYASAIQPQQSLFVCVGMWEMESLRSFLIAGFLFLVKSITLVSHGESDAVLGERTLESALRNQHKWKNESVKLQYKTDSWPWSQPTKVSKDNRNVSYLQYSTLAWKERGVFIYLLHCLHITSLTKRPKHWKFVSHRKLPVISMLYIFVDIHLIEVIV